MQRLGCSTGGYQKQWFGCSTDDVEPSLMEAEFIKQQLQQTPNSKLAPEAKKSVEKKWNSIRKPHFHILQEVLRVLLEIFLVAPVYRWLSCLTQRLFVRDLTTAAVEAVLLRHPDGELFTETAKTGQRYRMKIMKTEVSSAKGDADPAAEKTKEEEKKRKGKKKKKKKEEKEEEEEEEEEEEKKKKGEKRDIVFVWFNAWLYDDTDNMVSAGMPFVYRVSQQSSALSLLSCSGSVWYRSCMKQPRSILAANMPLPRGERSFTGQCCQC
jgi:hypothetical protein